MIPDLTQIETAEPDLRSLPIDVQHRISIATDPKTGRPYKLLPTPALIKDVLDWFENGCQHASITPKRKSNRAGGYGLRNYCDECGRPEGTHLKRSDFADPEAVPVLEIDHFDHQQRRTAELDIIKVEHLRRQRERSNVEYQAYLQSAAWKNKRQKVFERANGLCEGCRSARPSQVHHITYDHLYDELLFELAALCADCHRRAHGTNIDEETD